MINLRNLIVPCLAFSLSTASINAASYSLGSDFAISEDSGNAVVTITRNDPNGAQDITVSTVDGSALGSIDFTPLSGTIVSFADGDNSRTVSIPIINDTDSECSETFELEINSVGVGNSISGGTVTITIEESDFVTLTWDDGALPGGNNGLYNRGFDANGGTYCFRIITGNSDIWRTVLDVQSGEADLEMHRGAFDADDAPDYSSNSSASDGILLHTNQFNNSEEWYIRVTAQAGSSWSLYSGDIHVIDEGTLVTETSPGYAPLVRTIPPEGALFFKATPAAGANAWALWLNGYASGGPNNQIAIRKNAPGLPTVTNFYDFREADKMLLVPPYFGDLSDTYFVSIQGNEGDSVTIDSHLIEPKVISSGFTETAITERSSGAPYAIFEIDVPISFIAWDLVLQNIVSGDPNIAVAKGSVPSPWQNAAYSEASGSTTEDSITLVPPTLTNGIWYITVYSDGAFETDLSNGQPEFTGALTNIDFLDDDTGLVTPILQPGPDSVLNPQPARTGWYYFRASKIAEQSGLLGWDLSLTNEIAGTEIAIRQNAVPGRTYRRNAGTSTGTELSDTDIATLTTNSYDDVSSLGFLQRPSQQADVWYVGIHLRDQQLGAFRLERDELQPITATPNNFSDSVTGGSPHLPNTWRFYRFDLEDGITAWETEIENIVGGNPRLIIRRALLPNTLNASSPQNINTWNNGTSTTLASDWFSRTGNAQYKSLLLAAGDPLETDPSSPITYYAGIFNDSTESTTYDFASAIIDDDLTPYPAPVELVQTVSFNGGSATITNLPPEQAQYFKVTIPANTASWRLRLANTSGESRLAVKRGFIPDYEASGTGDVAVRGGYRMVRAGSEVFQLLPISNSASLVAGDYYVAVVSEQGSTFSGTLTSEGEIPITALGTPAAQITQPYNIPADEIALYTFTVPANALAVEIKLNESAGRTDLALRSDALIPRPSSTSNAEGFRYGFNGGNIATDTDFIYTYQNPIAGTYSINLRAERISSTTPLASSGDLVITIITATDVALEGSSTAVANHPAGSWRYFRVIVPSNGILSGDSSPILGWNPRLTGVGSLGDVRLVVTKGSAHNQSSSTATTGFSPSSPSRNTSWPLGASWSETVDFTNRSNDSTGTSRLFDSLVAAWGKPLDGGTYYVGIYNNSSTEAASYTFESRTIGEPGSSSSLLVEDLTFNGGSSTQSGVSPRDFRVFRVTIPSGGATSWRAQLNVTGSNEANLSIREGFIPDFQGGNNVLTTQPNDDRFSNAGGTLVQKDGSECYSLLPEEGVELIPAGTEFYLIATSEGTAPSNASQTGAGAVTFDVLSDGIIPSQNATLVNGLYTDSLTLKPAEVQLYTFTVPANASSLEVALTNKTGNETAFALRRGTLIPEPYLTVNAYNQQYGIDEGTDDSNFYNNNLVTIAEPEEGVYTLAIRSSSGSASSWQPNSTVDLRIEVLAPQNLSFCGGSASQVNQPPLSMRYYVVNVPADDAATRSDAAPAQAYLGWDVGIGNDFSGGAPRLYIRKADLPVLSGAPNQSRTTLWADGNQLNTPSSDWTKDSSRASDNAPINQFRNFVSMDQPLVPGLYFVGVYNNSSTQSTSYTIHSRCVGTTNSGADFEVSDLALVGGTASVSVEPREAEFFRVTIPANTYRTWRVTLTNTVGETSLSINRDFLPDFNTSDTGDADDSGFNVQMQRTGNEIYTLLPDNGQDFLTAGTYYLAVYGRGTNGTFSNVGTGTSTATLTSVGPIAEPDLGTLGGPGSTLNQTIDLDASEIAVYSFTISAPDPLSPNQIVEIRLDNRTGDPWLSLRADTRIARPNVGSSTSLRYGFDEGNNFLTSDDQILTLINPDPGQYTLTIHARAAAFNPVDASADLVVENVVIQPLAFSSLNAMPPALPHFRDAAIIDGQKRYYQVEIPEFLTVTGDDTGGPDPEGDAILPILAWKIALEESSGDVRMRVMSDLAASGGFTTAAADDIAIVVPPVLRPGNVYYIEVLGSGLADFRITSSAVEFNNIWSMPETYNVEFGDSFATDLAEDDWHFHAVDVPKDNGGLLRTELVALSGDPNLYIREDGVPTLNHNTSGTTGTIFDRRFDGNDTEYANWVPLDGRSEIELRPGRWIIGIRANNTNSRYQLKVSTGDVEEIAYANLGTALENRSVLSNDFKYYVFTVPEIPDTPAALLINFSEDFGDVNLHLRDTIPPGHSTRLPSSPTSSTDFIVDADDDNKNRWTAWGSNSSGINNPGTYTFPFPNLRPGATYFIGMRGRIDGTYDLTPSVTTEKVTDAPGSSAFTTYGPIADVSFFAGTVTFNLAPGEYRAFRIASPDGATRWINSNVNTTNVNYRLEQGTLPPLTGATDHDTNSANSGFNRPLNDSWPWVPGEDYYALFINNGGTTETVTFTMSGEGAGTRFEGWMASFGLTGAAALGDAINNTQGIPNLLAYALNIDPINGVASNAPVNPLPIPVISDNDPAFGGIEFYLPVNPPDDICYVIEANDLLVGPWTDIGIRAGNGGWVGSAYFLEGNPSSGYIRQTIFSPFSLNSKDKNFFRLRVVPLHP